MASAALVNSLLDCRGIKVSKEFRLRALERNVLPSKSAFEACVGGVHIVVNPHRQRLLVASHKQAKIDKNAKKSGNTKDPKAQAADDAKKVDIDGGEPNATGPPESTTKCPKPSKKATPKKKKKKTAGSTTVRSDTPYNVARKAFFAEPLE